jgi:signal transduction histidine kinase/CheY-like chemotaxis protein
MSTFRLLTHQLRREEDVVTARQRARQIASAIGFDLHEQTRIGTAVSEIARNAFRYAGGGLVAFEILSQAPQSLIITVSDRGPGIDDRELVLSGNYVSASGMGIGLAGARRLMDEFDLRTGTAGTTVTLKKRIASRNSVGAQQVNDMIAGLQRLAAPSPFDELLEQNHDLLRAMEEVQLRQAENDRLNDELAETNRGVLALNAELEDKAESLRQASETKSRFLSHMSHEFRTPLNSIRSLAAMLASKMDGPLSAEQDRQVEFIRRAADSLLDLVNDLLDLAKIEAGKVEVTATRFAISDLFSTLRGMFRPLVHSDAVTLRFEDTSHLPSLVSDESKLSQILRNLISNALKFTERGEIVVSATQTSDQRIAITVRDTGIGIPPEHVSSLFQEFVQIMNPLQKKAKGTGLGLSLSQQLATLLGGSIEVESTFGAGSAFTVLIPSLTHHAPGDSPPDGVPRHPHAHGAPLIMIIDDEDADRYALRALIPPQCEIVESTGGHDALDQLARHLPDIVFLDLNMPELDGYEVLTAIKNAPDTRDVRVIIHSSLAIDEGVASQLVAAGAETILEKGFSDLEAMRSRITELISFPQ